MRAHITPMVGGLSFPAFSLGRNGTFKLQKSSTTSSGHMLPEGDPFAKEDLQQDDEQALEILDDYFAGVT